MAQPQDACTLLDQEHNEVFDLFEQYKTAHDARHHELLAERICQSLLVHMQIEEEIFYPAFRQATGDMDRLQDSVHEHQEARELIAKIDENRHDAKLVLKLEEEIVHHVHDERTKMFPEARASSMDLMKLGRQLQARKTELTTAHA